MYQVRSRFTRLGEFLCPNESTKIAQSVATAYALEITKIYLAAFMNSLFLVTNLWFSRKMWKTT